MLSKKKVFTKIFQAISKKKVFTKIFQAISTKKRFPKNFSSTPQNFNNSKNSAVLEPRTGQFSRNRGLEAKAKDLTFEAKAKDFKMCPRGQGRPRELHLCYIVYIVLCEKIFPLLLRYALSPKHQTDFAKHLVIGSLLYKNTFPAKGLIE